MKIHIATLFAACFVLSGHAESLKLPVSGNIYLYCAAQNLATVCRATMDREKLKKGLGLSDNMTLHLNHPVGHFAGGK